MTGAWVSHLEVMCNMSKQSRAGRKSTDMVVVEGAGSGGAGSGEQNEERLWTPEKQKE